MRLEYFQMLDQIVETDLDARRIPLALHGAEGKHDLRGSFSNLPVDARRAADRVHGAQTTGWLVCMLGRFETMPFLAGIKEGKFRTTVHPGDTLEFEGTVIYEGSGFAVAECAGRRGGAKVCDARLTFRIMPFPTPQFRQTFYEWGERLKLPIREFAK